MQLQEVVSQQSECCSPEQGQVSQGEVDVLNTDEGCAVATSSMEDEWAKSVAGSAR